MDATIAREKVVILDRCRRIGLDGAVDVQETPAFQIEVGKLLVISCITVLQVKWMCPQDVGPDEDRLVAECDLVVPVGFFGPEGIDSVIQNLFRIAEHDFSLRMDFQECGKVGNDVFIDEHVVGVHKEDPLAGGQPDALVHCIVEPLVGFAYNPACRFDAFPVAVDDRHRPVFAGSVDDQVLQIAIGLSPHRQDGLFHDITGIVADRDDRYPGFGHCTGEYGFTYLSARTGCWRKSSYVSRIPSSNSVL